MIQPNGCLREQSPSTRAPGQTCAINLAAARPSGGFAENDIIGNNGRAEGKRGRSIVWSQNSLNRRRATSQ
jgi:hypothetical protein